jgi:prophage maintenance system killer protein
MERLSVEDLLLIAEQVLGTPAERLAREARLAVAATALAAPFAVRRGRERHGTLAEKAATLCIRLVRDRPLAAGNEQVALLAMLELVARNHGVWLPPLGGQDEIAGMIALLAVGQLSDAAFLGWMRERVPSR